MKKFLSLCLSLIIITNFCLVNTNLPYVYGEGYIQSEAIGIANTGQEIVYATLVLGTVLLYTTITNASKVLFDYDINKKAVELVGDRLSLSSYGKSERKLYNDNPEMFFTSFILGAISGGEGIGFELLGGGGEVDSEPLGDAIRHTGWSQGLSKMLGEERAKMITDFHEDGGLTQDNIMDYVNNARGYSCAGSAKCGYWDAIFDMQNRNFEDFRGTKTITKEEKEKLISEFYKEITGKDINQISNDNGILENFYYPFIDSIGDIVCSMSGECDYNHETKRGLDNLTELMCELFGGCYPTCAILDLNCGGFDKSNYKTGTKQLSIYRDPSGFIYSIHPENRIIGAKATIYQLVDYDDTPIITPPPEGTATEDEIAPQGAGYHWLQWDDESGEWPNPILTTTDGRYRWDTPPGWWRIKIEKDGYQTTCSQGTTGSTCQDFVATSSGRDVFVPPEETTLDFGMIDIGAPTFKSISPDNSIKLISTGAEVVFETSEKMTPASITGSNISLTGPQGSVPVQVEEGANPLTYNYQYTVRPTQELTQYQNYTISISNLKDYAGNILSSQSATYNIEDPYPYIKSNAITGNSSIKLIFNKSMSGATLNHNNISISGSIINTFTLSQSKYPNDTLTLGVVLASSTGYFMTVGTGSLDTSGNQLNNGHYPSVLSFETAGTAQSSFQENYSESLDSIISLSEYSSGSLILPTNKNTMYLRPNQTINLLPGLLTQNNSKAVTLRSGTGEFLIISSTDNYSIKIKNQTIISSSLSWNGEFIPPKDIKSSAFIQGYTSKYAVKVGNDLYPIELDNPAIVILPGVTGTPFYHSPGDANWTQITLACDDKEVPTNIPLNQECYYRDINSNQTIIHTYHLTDFGLFDVYTGSMQSLVKLKISEGGVTIGAPTAINFGTGTVNNVDDYIDIQTSTSNATGGTGFSGEDYGYFWVEDLKSATGGYSTTLQISNLTQTGTTKVISSNNVTMTLTGGTSSITVLDGLSGTGSTIPSEVNLINQDNVIVGNALSAITRTGATTPVPGIVGKYGFQPKFKVKVPAYQDIGQYTSTMTYTLIE